MASIIVVFPKLEDAKGIRNLLAKSGFDVATACSSGAHAISKADGLSSGIIVTGYKLSDMLYSEVVECKPKSFEVLLLASEKRLANCSGPGFRTLAMPLKPYDLVSILNEMLSNMEVRKKQAKKAPPRRSPEEQKIIDRAKLILMEHEELTEPEAYRYIQKCSMESGNRFIDSAYKILSMYQ